MIPFSIFEYVGALFLVAVVLAVAPALFLAARLRWRQFWVGWAFAWYLTPRKGPLPTPREFRAFVSMLPWCLAWAFVGRIK